MRWIEWSEDRFELGVVGGDDDVSRVEAEPLPPVRLEPIRVFRADQREHAAMGGRPLELEDYARIGWNAGARHSHLSPTVQHSGGMEESSPYGCTRPSSGTNASQSVGLVTVRE